MHVSYKSNVVRHYTTARNQQAESLTITMITRGGAACEAKFDCVYLEEHLIDIPEVALRQAAVGKPFDDIEHVLFVARADDAMLADHAVEHRIGSRE